MTYLLRHARVRPAPDAARAGPRVDERTLLNLPEFDGGATVRVFVENTSWRRVRRRRIPSPRTKLWISSCVNRIDLEFAVDTPELRENSRHKIDTLITALELFRAGLIEESELREARERGARAGKEARCRT